MAQKKKKKKSEPKTQLDHFWGMPLKPWVASAKISKRSELTSGKRGFIYYFGRRDLKQEKSILTKHLSPWQMQLHAQNPGEIFFAAGKLGPVWVLRPNLEKSASTHHGQLDRSAATRARDQVGALVGQFQTYKIEKIGIEFFHASSEEQKGALVGLELGAYSFAEHRETRTRPRRKQPKILLLKDTLTLNQSEIEEASRLALATNLCRHLVNLPGGTLNPKTYADSIRDLFHPYESIKVDIWAGDKLREEKMNLLIAVGGAASEGPRFVHLRYRPAHSEGRRPLAFVGKGVTFDSGGLDIKPSSGMRLMKKDMGGSAAVVGLAWWVATTEFEYPCDFYLPLAENAVGSASFRPGDIITARSGTSVEIHNTDAEGRLVLADALDVAVKKGEGEKPLLVVNLATLTGAIKIALGADISGLFSNHDLLADMISEASQTAGELTWRMPLYPSYRALLRSNFADVANASDGFAGAITAALFLESFVDGVPWAHLDIYSWKDAAAGAIAEPGGNGQPVQAMVELLHRIAAKGDMALSV